MKNTALIIAGSVLMAFTVMPAHAISEKYRQQLERSGCTQVTDGNGCDIRKTKAENMKTAPKNDKKELNEFLHDSVIGQKTDDAYVALEGYGYESTSPGTWKKGNITVILDIENDIIQHATVTP